MWIYIFVLLLIWSVYMLQGKQLVKSPDFFTDKEVRKKIGISVFFIGTVLFALSALRSVEVGIDTISYFWTYERLPASMPELSLSFLAEDGYTLLQYVCKNIGVGFRGVIVFASALFVFPVTYLIYKYSENPYLSLYYFVTLDYFCFSMSGMRQCIAIGLCMIAFEMAQRKKLLLYVLFVGLAVTFHSTAIVFLPVYFLKNVPIRKRHVYPFVFLGILCFVFKSSIVNFLQSLSRNFYEVMPTGGTGMYLYMLMSVILAFLYSAEWSEENGNAKSLINYMMIVAVVMFPVLQFNPTVFRLHYYYSLVIVMFIPNVLKNVKETRVRFFASMFFFIVAAYYFCAYTMNNMGVNPYYVLQ